MNQHLAKLWNSPLEFIRSLMIIDKRGKLVRFGDVITPGQIEIIKALETHKQVAIVKARQLGISTVVRAFCFWEYYTSRQACRSMCAAHKHDLSKALLSMDKNFYKKIPVPVKRKLESDTIQYMKFAENATDVRAETAGSRKQARGYTLNTAHLSEYAYYDDAETYLGSIIASVNGRIIVESTPNHHDDPLHKIVTSNSPEWHVVFLPWYSFPEYAEPVGAEFQRTEEEDELANAFNLTDAQLYWRRKKMSSYNDPWLFKRDFPITIEEAWTLGDDNYFTEAQLRHLIVKQLDNRDSMIISEPMPNDVYTIGVDPAGGTGGDYSAAYVLSKLDRVPVAILCSNKLSIRDFATQVVALANKYNNALIHYELNNHGHAFKEVLNNLVYRNCRSFITTTQSKIKLFDDLRTAITNGTIIAIDNKLGTELRQLQRRNNLAPCPPNGGHDDRVIAFSLAIDALRFVTLPVDPYSAMFIKERGPQSNNILSKSNLVKR